MPDLLIRPLSSFEEFEACVELQKKTWGRKFDDVVSAALMRVAQKIGGIAAGAFDPGDSLVAILFGLSGTLDDVQVHWSHMLAVEPEWRGRGLGTLLKVYQRRRVVALGVDRMYWTFDPLEARNAHFNVNRLGVRIEDYVHDMYGSGETSTLHRGIGTDRFIVVWPLNDSQVWSRAEKVEKSIRWDESGTSAAIDLSADMLIPVGMNREDVKPIGADIAAMGSEPDVRHGGAVLVEIPPDIQRLKIAHPSEATSWRTATRTAFVHYFAQGLTVTGFLRDPESARCFYVMDRAQPDST